MHQKDGLPKQIGQQNRQPDLCMVFQPLEDGCGGQTHCTQNSAQHLQGSNMLPDSTVMRIQRNPEHAEQAPTVYMYVSSTVWAFGVASAQLEHFTDVSVKKACCSINSVHVVMSYVLGRVLQYVAPGSGIHLLQVSR